MRWGSRNRAAHASEAERLLIELDDSIGLANLYLNRGRAPGTNHAGRDAVADFRASAERYQRAGDVLGSALADNNLAEVLTLQHRLDEAERLLIHARRVTEAANNPLGTIHHHQWAVTDRGVARRHRACAACCRRQALAGFRGASEPATSSPTRSSAWSRSHVIAGELAAAFEAAERAPSGDDRRSGDVPVLPAHA